MDKPMDEVNGITLKFDRKETAYAFCNRFYPVRDGMLHPNEKINKALMVFSNTIWEEGFNLVGIKIGQGASRTHEGNSLCIPNEETEKT